MSGLLDTSVVVRYLTGDPPATAAVAARIIDGEDDLILTTVVLVETAYVLTSVYAVERGAIVNTLIALVQKENVRVLDLDKGTVLQALLMCRRSGRVSFADALVWAAARTHPSRTVYSFDERFPAAGLDVRRAS